MKPHMRYICLILSIICLAYYILCVSYAGRKSSFIWIWLLGTIFFAGRKQVASRAEGEEKQVILSCYMKGAKN